MSASTDIRFSIIVPVLNGALGMASLCQELARLRLAGAEVWLVDGGSSDATVDLAIAAGFEISRSEAGRAMQMNAGAARAKGEVLVFLHADTVLPSDALALIDTAMRDPGANWGRFDVHIQGRSAWLRVVGAMINWRSRLSGVATGDQAMFVRRSTFEQIGGFLPIALMEDVALSKRLLKIAKPVCLRAKVTTSGRRWDTRGVWRTVALMWRLRWAYWRGADPNQLAKLYK